MKRTLAIAALLALTGAGLATASGEAVADSCPSGAACAYAATNWSGKAYPVYEDNNSLTGFYGWTHAESIYNNGKSCNVYIFSETNRHGTRYPLNRGTGWKSVSGSALWHHAYSNQWYGC